MVKRILAPLTGLWLLLAATFPAAAGELSVEPDRKQLYEGEVLTVTVKGTMELDINLSNLFEFDLSQLPAPDIEKVEPDFEILARNQQYSIRTVNSQMIGEITWTYQLAPTRTGKLTIPELTFRDTTSEPVTIEVLSGTAPDQGPQVRDSFVELSADKAEVYVQEQLTLTVRLFFTGNLIRGELSEPQHPDAIIESLGKQQEYTRYRDGVRYRVVERRYAVFPQKTGELDLPPIRFEGQARTQEGKLRFLRDSEEFFAVPVKEVPAGYTGDTWLPASDLSLEESGLPPSLEVDMGENLTRRITLKALDLPSEALPPLPGNTPEGIRAYPDQPERSTRVTPDGLTSSLEQTVALVPVQAGEMTLPEIRVTWWDTDTDRQQVAVIPARTLSVRNTGAASEPPSTEPPENATSTNAGASGPLTDKAPETTGSVWPWVSLGLAIAWGLTLAGWWWSGKRTRKTRKPAARQHGEIKERALFDELVIAARKGSGETPRQLIRWMQHRYPDQHFHSAGDVVDFLGDETLKTELERLQADLFAAERNGKPGTTDRQALVRVLEQIRRNKPRSGDREGLRPLYPGNLSA
ncbi:BatD family protein [Marinobacter pelagius]|uniref:BatD family protein n=1 Tax=Marinobacter sp. C7 TaxID=2951363 RepID=UPI001EF09212|nr:BatD family protein [Marinobacter sp. C7]MCG7199213.1 BatD family protein [Marinobacter sp. C7]